MRKKLLIAALMLSVALSVGACGKKEEKEPPKVEENNQPTEEAKKEIPLSERGDLFLDEDGNLYMSESELSKRLTKVTITNDNWKDYFEDFDYTETKVVKREDGTVQSEEEVHYVGFGLKVGTYAFMKDVEVKFDGETVYDEYAVINEETGEAKPGKYVLTAGSDVCKVYDADGNLVETQPLGEPKEYFVAEIVMDRDYCSGLSYSDHKFLGASGEMLFVDMNMPAEIKDNMISTDIYLVKGDEAVYLSDDNFDEIATYAK